LLLGALIIFVALLAYVNGFEAHEFKEKSRKGARKVQRKEKDLVKEIQRKPFDVEILFLEDHG
jgi:hypothetical protein